MQSLRIRGGHPLEGTVDISGAKNAALPILAAAVCFGDICTIHNCPNLTDVDAALEILSFLGAVYERGSTAITIDPRPIACREIPSDLMGKMRGSLFFMGPLMARFGICRIHSPGGCPLGDRPMDYHLQGLAGLGADIRTDGMVECSGPLTGAELILPYPSVGATENLLMAALGARGETLLRNAAREPEICCLCDFLRSGGCRISGDGTDTIHIREGLPGRGEITLIPDRMEAATYLCAAASAGGSITLNNTAPDHLTAVLDVLKRSGCEIEAGETSVSLTATGLHSPGTLTTGPYPGFPTDAQAPVMAALLRAKGKTVIQESVFSHRMRHIPALRTLGGHIICRENTAIVTGVSQLRGGMVECTDLRGGAALAIAALATQDETEITGLTHILRGYEDIAGKLRALGADARIS